MLGLLETLELDCILLHVSNKLQNTSCQIRQTASGWRSASGSVSGNTAAIPRTPKHPLIKKGYLLCIDLRAPITSSAIAAEEPH